MKSRSPLSLALRSAVLWLALSAPFVALYVAFDPMNVLRWHEDMMPNGYISNKGTISALQFVHNNPAMHYDSFILGSSLAINFHTDVWMKYLPEDAVPYHFDSSGMNISQLEKSLEYICANSNPANILIIWDLGFNMDTGGDWYENVEGRSQFLTAPQIAPHPLRETNLWQFLSTWYSRSYLNGWICHRLIKSRPKGSNNYPVYPGTTYDPTTNEERNPAKDDSLKVLSDSFLLVHPHFADYRIPCLRASNQISDEAKAVAMHIASLLENSGADYRFVMAPNRIHLIPSADDDKFLRETFGDRYILTQPDLGYLTANPYYYFDHYHFRPEMAEKVMEYIYTR